MAKETKKKNGQKQAPHKKGNLSGLKKNENVLVIKEMKNKTMMRQGYPTDGYIKSKQSPVLV